jgi:integrase
MSLKGQKTTSSHVEWNDIVSLILKLERDKEYKFALLISVGCYTALRISDILSLKFSDLLWKDHFTIIEKKTKKSRTITINNDLKDILSRCYIGMGISDSHQPIFLNRFGNNVITIQYVNRRLKELMTKYRVVKDTSVIKSHSLRKTFSSHVWDRNGNSDRSLVLLSEVLNHANISTTKIYLSIRQEEIGEIYQNL